MKSAIVIAICRILKLSNGWMRYKLGACPECNSSAPELYDCPVCEYGKAKKPETWNRFVRARSAIVIAAMMLAGCTQTKIKTPTWSLTRTSVLQSTAVPKITVLNDGSIEVEGYSNDGGATAIDKATALINAANNLKSP
jgi:hypothetical protein